MRFAKRSWGWYFVLLDRKHFKVKLLRFKKNGECSIQKHFYRSELWLFLKGNGIFSSGEDHSVPWKFKADAKNVSYFLVRPQYWHHYIANIPTLILEIQYGEKCEESDIVRI